MPIALRQARPLHVMRIPVHGCENRYIAPTPARPTRNTPEKISSPMSSLLPTCPGGDGRMKDKLNKV
jgi:hypothetical protein